MPGRIVHIVTVPDSLRTFFTGQIGYMKRAGLDVHVISSPGPLLKEFAQTEGIDDHAVEMPRRVSPLRDCVAILSLFLAFRRIRPDIVHAHTPKAGLLAMIAAWAAHVPVRIYHIRGLPLVTTNGVRRWLLQISEKLACRLAHQVLSVSHSLAAVALQENICCPEKISVLQGGSGNGVDTEDRFNPLKVSSQVVFEIRKSLGIAADEMIIGFVGRLACDKGIIELAESWSDLRNEYPRLHLLVVGALDLRDPVPHSVLEMLKNDPRIHLVGQTKEPQHYYRTFDVCVLPTYREGLSNVLLEAAAMECPVVATRVPGCVDVVVDGETGLLVPARSASALRQAIQDYLRSKPLRTQHGKAARNWAKERFSQERLWNALYEQYRKLAESNEVNSLRSARHLDPQSRAA